MDGTLIDLCGATLLWRSAEGLSRTPTPKHLEVLRRELNAARPQCPVGLHTLAFPSLDRSFGGSTHDHQPWAYLHCGHVHGYHIWRGRRGLTKEGSTEEDEDESKEELEQEPLREGERECPLCRTRGLYVPLKLGRESGFYLDGAPPTHAFNPCGHVCSERTAAFWSKLVLPHGAHGFFPACPFCMRPLARDRKCVRLIFQGPLD